MNFKLNRNAAVLWTPEGLYKYNGTWQLLVNLDQCPKEIDLYVHGFSVNMDHQKLPPMNPFRAHQVLDARLIHETNTRQALGWGTITPTSIVSFLNLAFLSNPLAPPAFKDWNIQVHKCEWLSFGFNGILKEFQTQQPCGGVLALGQNLSGQWQILFGYENALRLIRAVPLETQIEPMLKETLHYCLNEYGIDPADVKLLNLTPLILEDSYHLHPGFTYRPLEDILINPILNKPLRENYLTKWAHPMNAYPFGKKPQRTFTWGFKTACFAAFLYLLGDGFEAWMRNRDLQALRQEVGILSQSIEELKRPLQLIQEPDWEILEGFVRPLEPLKLFDRLRDLGPLALENFLIQEFLWSLDETGEKLKIRYNDHPDHLQENQESSDLHGLIYKRIREIWGDQIQVELHNNRIEVNF